jgi:hypothetical protein
MNSRRKFIGFDRSSPIGRDRKGRVSSGLRLPRRNGLSNPIPPRPKNENPKELDRDIEEWAVKEPILRRWIGLSPWTIPSGIIARTVEGCSSIRACVTGSFWKVILCRPNPSSIDFPESIAPIADRSFNPKPRESCPKISMAINW